MTYAQSILDERHDVLINRTRTQAEIDLLIADQMTLGANCYAGWAFCLFVDDLYEAGIINERVGWQLLQPYL